MDCSPPGSSVHGILRARMLEWVPMPSSRGSSQPRDRAEVSCIAGRFFTVWATREAQYICIYAHIHIHTIGMTHEVAHRKFQRKFWRVRTAGSNRQTAPGALLSSGGIKPLCFLSSITQIKIPSPRRDSIASHTHLLARKRQGSLINSTSQAAFLTKMSRWYYGKRDNRKRGKKCTAWSQYAFLPKKEREREKQKEAKKTMDIDIQHESSHNPRNWNIFTFTPFDYLKKKDFSIAYYRLRRTPHQLWRIFSCQ